MQTRFIPTTLATSFLLAATLGAQAETEAVEGRISLTYSMQQATVVPDVVGHTLHLNEAAGQNRAVKGGYMASARIANSEFLDLVQGNGPHQGYITMTEGDGETVSRWSGQVTTRMEGEQPVTTFKGSWKVVSGNGKYADISGGGTYQGHFTSKTDYVVDWQGSVEW